MEFISMSHAGLDVNRAEQGRQASSQAEQPLDGFDFIIKLIIIWIVRA